MFIISFTRVRWGDLSSDHNPQSGSLCRGRGSADACWGYFSPALVHRALVKVLEDGRTQTWGDGGWEDSVTLELTAQGSKLSAK